VGTKTRYKRIATGQAVHRATIEARLGRRLATTEHVHHINGDKLDNRREGEFLLEYDDEQD
jgi:hypothetical protein